MVPVPIDVMLYEAPRRMGALIRSSVDGVGDDLLVANQGRNAVVSPGKVFSAVSSPVQTILYECGADDQ